MVDRTGKQFGNYRLVRLLGQGGFAEVYLGEHIHLGTQAAVKILSTHLDTASIEQFRNEAQIIAHFEHPHIVRVFDFGIENGIPFFVMSYASGGTLRQKHSRGTCLPLATVVSYVKQIAPALQYAHFRKHVHRDIKPENILIGADHKLVLSDFGIAIVAHNFQSLTPQVILGTPYYMAPEQSQGQALPASDQYALGIMVYEWLTGVRPFDGSSPVEIMMKHISHIPPSLQQVVPSLSSAIEQVVMKTLGKEPEKRYTSVVEFAQALDGAYRAEQHPPLESQQRELLYSYKAPSHNKCSFSWMQNDPLTATGDIDGKIEVWNHRRTARLFSTQIHPSTKKLRDLVLSPSGSYLACLTEDTEEKKMTLQLWDLDKGRVLASYEAEGFLLWSPDSTSIAFVNTGRESGLQTLHVGKVDQTQLIATIEDILLKRRPRMPAWSPDGRYIALPPEEIRQVGLAVSVYDVGVENALHVFSSSHDANSLWSPTDLTGKGWRMESASSIWSPNAAYLANCASWSFTRRVQLSEDNIDQWNPLRIYIWRVDQVSLMRTKSQAPIISRSDVETLAWSPDGTCIAFALRKPVVEIWDIVGEKSLKTYTGHTHRVFALAWSPDNRYIASADINGNIHVWDTDLAKCILAWHSQTEGAKLEWSLSGRELAFISQDSRMLQIWRVV